MQTLNKRPLVLHRPLSPAPTSMTASRSLFIVHIAIMAGILIGLTFFYWNNINKVRTPTHNQRMAVEIKTDLLATVTPQTVYFDLNNPKPVLVHLVAHSISPWQVLFTPENMEGHKILVQPVGIQKHKKSMDYTLSLIPTSNKKTITSPQKGTLHVQLIGVY